MDIRDYELLIKDVIDFEINMDSFGQSRRTLLQLKERREILIEMRGNVKKDIRTVELEFLNRRSAIQEAYLRENEKTSRKSRFLKSGTPSSMRAKAMRHLETERNTKINAYESVKITVDDLIIQVEDLMIDVYNSMKNSLHNSHDKIVIESK